MEHQDTRQLIKKRNRNLTLAIISLFLFAGLFRLGTFFVWILIGCIIWFSFQAAFFHAQVKNATAPFRYAKKHSTPQADEMKQYIRKHLIITALILLAGLILALTVIYFSGGD